MTHLLTDPQAWIALLTLTALELVLGIDNVIFISILVDKLPKQSRDLARRIGLSLDRPAHIHFAVTAPGYARLVTSIFDGSDPAIGRDALFAVKPGLIGDFRAEKSGVSLSVALVLDRDDASQRSSEEG